ncbi:hypothetical protein [Cyclobacterium salsum]|uniref:hypothetical protein n=1 Tax=Cyclobacterium salsum TaxID=2666329 RepID=UPI001F33081C|nr:hypothetical protein [Cyclobacterium salsum]
MIFEGALRKWFLPGLAAPLLVIRDPIAIFILFKAWQRGILLPNIYIGVTIIVAIFSFYTALFLGHGNLPVAVFGARILIVHFPLMFVMGAVFCREDVIKVGKISLLIAIPMAVLIALQFYSSQSAWVNRGVGGDIEGAGFSGALGYSRPPGTFSFTSGVTQFYGLVGSYLVYFWFDSAKINRVVLFGATFALMVAIPLSISRSLFFSFLVTLLFAVIITLVNPNQLGKTIGALIGLALLLLILAQVNLFQTATEVFTARFENANSSEGGVEGVLLDRYLGGLAGAILEGAEGDMPFFGYGIGMGTNVGSMLLTGEMTFLIAEGEWGRLIGEIGFLMGFIIILVRIMFALKLTLASFNQMFQGNYLPWMLLSFALLIIPQGQWAQPTSLGFSTLIGGLMIASLRNSEKK